MPNCFSLTRKSEPEKGPVSLSAIDEEMCKHLGVACDARSYYHEWYMVVGFRLATGKSFEQIRKEFKDAFEEDQDDRILTDLKIVDWLDENFTSDAWYQVGK